MFIEAKHLAVATFIICFVIVISVFAGVSIVLNYLEDQGNLITGYAVKETKEPEGFIVGEVVGEISYEADIIELNDSLGLCDIRLIDGNYRGRCNQPIGRFILQMLVKNTGDKRILNLKDKVSCKSTQTEFWSFLGPSSEGVVYDQVINEEPYVAVLEPGNSFIYKLITQGKGIKDEEVDCSIRLFSTETSFQLKKNVFLNFTEEVVDETFDDKSYLNSIISSIDRRDWKKLTYG